MCQRIALPKVATFDDVRESNGARASDAQADRSEQHPLR
jgi:hypothetical protein